MMKSRKMIYEVPNPEAPLDQGDLIDNCPVNLIRSIAPDLANQSVVDFDFQRVIVLTQTCDLANEKVTFANVAEVFDAQFLIDQQLFKPADVKGPLRAGRIWGWYFLPADATLRLREMIIDLRRLHTIRLALLRELCRAGKRRARVQPLYREHLAKHFADTFSRIGLPRPYETL
jgi:hypothetical protein